MIAEDEKEKIRAEEIFREEIRKEISKPKSKWINFLNTPLGIWFLSTIVIGLLSLSYKTWQENLEKRKTNQKKIEQIADEGKFRIQQIDDVIRDSISLQNKCINSQKQSGGIKGSDFRDFIEAAKRITVTFDLGGIFNIPQEEGTNTWIGSSGYSIRHLPYKKSYKKNEFKSDTLFDLASKIQKCTDKNSKELQKLESQFKELQNLYKFEFKALLDDWRKRHQATGQYKDIYKPAYKVYDLKMDDYGDEVNQIGT